jgi:hypothetical protein
MNVVVDKLVRCCGILKYLFTDKLFRKRKKVSYSSSSSISLFVNVIIRRDDACGITIKGNDSGGWSSADVLLWLGRGQNVDAVEW